MADIAKQVGQLATLQIGSANAPTWQTKAEENRSFTTC
jgi:hypothetical protein